MEFNAETPETGKVSLAYRVVSHRLSRWLFPET
jgi:hypothetical protein